MSFTVIYLVKSIYPLSYGLIGTINKQVFLNFEKPFHLLFLIKNKNCNGVNNSKVVEVIFLKIDKRIINEI